MDEVINDESMVVTTDSRGGRETVTITRGNEFGGESWHIEKTGKTGSRLFILQCFGNAL